eukprot:GEMP01021877.1.p1 GENE.GEMP01021877.1~~GEMP01021877.1.p1  ORF type:complete len:435 (+),score=100.54 GEMP01021877.1:45-1349(+)
MSQPSSPKRAKLNCGPVDPVEDFRCLLQQRTVSAEGPSGAYARCVEWLKTFIKRRCPQLELFVEEPVQNKPILLAVWRGRDPSLPSVLLNSHYDVVPCMQDHWGTDPFAAVVKDGKIYGRGTQDMKCVCVQYVLALEKLREGKFEPLRNIWLTFVPDEEIGGADGLYKLLHSGAWDKLIGQVAVALDEGLASPTDAYTVFYGERTPWWLIVRATGKTGHGSRFIEDTAPTKILEVANQALAFRREQEKLFYGHDDHGCKHAKAKKLGEVVTINLTMLKTGVGSDDQWALNVIPSEAEAGFDCRIPPAFRLADFRALLDEWTKKEGVSWDVAPWTQRQNSHYVTPIEGEKATPWWRVFRDTLEGMGHKVEPEVFPAGTDSRFLREKGIPAFGFSPMKNCPILLHEHNEFIPISTFLEGIPIYAKLIETLANCEKP